MNLYLNIRYYQKEKFIVTNITNQNNNKSNALAVLVFSIGEPNNNGDEDCLAFLSKNSWNWNDESCSLRRPFICELHGSVILFQLECILILN